MALIHTIDSLWGRNYATGAATGNAVVSGTGSGSPPAPTGSASGLCGVIGAGAGTVPAPTGAATGLVGVKGTSAGTVPPPTGGGTGECKYSATGAGVAPQPRGGSGKTYNLKMQGRPVYISTEKAKVAELWDCIVHCEFRDTYLFDITLKSDYYRHEQKAEYATNGIVETGVAAAGRPYVRNNVQVVPNADFYGSFVTVDIDKKIPTDGFFKITDFEFHTIPRPGISPEFLVVGGTTLNGWE